MSERSEADYTSRSEASRSDSTAHEKGQRLYCARCKAEIEVIGPCPCEPPDQVFSCCGESMRPNTGVQVNLNVEG